MPDVTVKSAFQSTFSDTGDATRYGPTAHNASRLFTGGANGDVCVRDSTSATGASWLSAGLGTYAIGDLLYASSATALSRLADVAVGQVLVSGGVGVAPAWSASPTLTGLTLDGTGTGVVLANNNTDVLAITGSLNLSGTGVFGGSVQIANSGFFYWASRSAIGASADGKLELTVFAGNVGVGLDFSTDTVLKVRTRAQSAYSQVDALGYSTGGVAGVTTFGPAAVASITVKGGIVTAIS